MLLLLFSGLSGRHLAIFGPNELKFGLSTPMDLADVLDGSNLGNLGPERDQYFMRFSAIVMNLRSKIRKQAFK